MRDDPAFAIFLMLNAVTPFITPDPFWLANLPLVVAIMAFLLAFGLSHISLMQATIPAQVSARAARGSFASNRPHNQQRSSIGGFAGLTVEVSFFRLRVLLCRVNSLVLMLGWRINRI
jgi:hypothetical protein